jgi:molybdate transport system substrate-binding protein
MNPFPPWLPARQAGKHFSVPGIENVPDLHGDIVDPQLILFLSGSQYMVTHDLLETFKRSYTKYERIYAQTLPGGILEEQIEHGALVIGNLRITHRPDVFCAGRERIERLSIRKGWFDRSIVYASNRLAIMVREGNPKRIRSLNDLAQPKIRVSMPDPEREGIGDYLLRALRNAGGDELVKKILQEKVADGSTYMTSLHHLQTPMRIVEDWSDAGAVWYTEVQFQKRIGNLVDLVEIPEENNVQVTYLASRMKDALHKKAADDFLKFMSSPEGKEVYYKYGFQMIVEE